MTENINQCMIDLGVSMDEAIDTFKILGQSFTNCKINEDSLQQLKIPASVVCPDNAESSVEFFPNYNTITQLEARVAKLEKLVEELRTNAIERTENPNQKADLEIFDQKNEIEDDNIFNINTDMFQIGTAVNWNNIQGWLLDTKKDMEEYSFGTIYK